MATLGAHRVGDAGIFQLEAVTTRDLNGCSAAGTRERKNCHRESALSSDLSPRFHSSGMEPVAQTAPNRGCGPPSRRFAPRASPRPDQTASSSGPCRHGRIQRAAASRSTPSALQDVQRPSGRDSRLADQSDSASRPLRLSWHRHSCRSTAEQRSRTGCETQTRPGRHAGVGPPCHHAARQGLNQWGAPDLFRVWCLSGFDQTSC